MKLFKATPSHLSWATQKPIEEIEAERETGACYWVNGKRYVKQTDYHMVFSSFEEAKQYLIYHFTKRVERFEEQLAEEKENVKKAENL